MMSNIDANTKLCAVIGNPVKHSLSPLIHNAAFEAAGLNFVYVAFRIEDIAGCLQGMRALEGFRGMSVTIPHKMTIIPHLDHVETMALNVGSVNTVTNDNGKLIGSTTDGPGTLKAFEDAGVDLDGRKVLFLGSGGAVRAVAFAVAELTKAERITILGRTESRVMAIVDDLKAKTDANVHNGHLPGDLEGAMAEHDIVIHGTPIGMWPHDEDTAVPEHLFRKDQVVFDMVYRPYKTRLLEQAQQAGCLTIPGLEMLVNQAALQFQMWTGTEAPHQVMRDVIQAHLREKASA